MSDTIKLVVEISKVPKNDHERWALTHGTLLDKGDLISRGEVESVLHNDLHALISTDQLYQVYKDINRLYTYPLSNSVNSKKGDE